MALIKPKEAQVVRDRFEKEMEKEVHIIAFTTKDQQKCQYCDLTIQLLEEVASFAPDKIQLQVWDGDQNSQKVQEYGMDHFPGFVIRPFDQRAIQVKFYGIPSGHEFRTLLDDIILVSQGATPDLSPSVMAKVQSISTPTKIQVFITPTCPYCTKAVLMAHQFAMINPMISGEMVEAMEFPELSARYGVSSVPQIVINDGKHSFVGAQPEESFIAEVLKGL
jgi:glutaredoxin-like protein